MRRSTGVTVVAVLSLIGSSFTLLMGAFVAVLPFVAPKASSENSHFPPEFFKWMMFAAALVYLAPAIWGIATSVGLFRLKEWARISIIVFSVLLILTSGFSVLTFLVMPFPPPNQPMDASFVSGMRIFMTAFAASLAGIGIWWLAFFTRPGVMQQFVPARGSADASEAQGLRGTTAPAYRPPIPSRPLSLTIIAWLMVIGGLFAPISLLLRYPAMLFTRVVTGWPASLYYLAMAIVSLYAGVGLLRFKPLARTAAVAYYAFFFVNTAVFYLAPGGRSRMMELMQKSITSFPWMEAERWQSQVAPQFSAPGFLVLVALSALVGLLTPIYFLVTRKQAFERAAAARGLDTTAAG